MPDASQMCAVTLHTGTSSRSVNALYDWNFLAASPCVLISMANAYCYQVSGYGTMVVGHGVVKTTSRLFGDGRRRRLLSSDLPSSAEDPAVSEAHLLRSDIASFSRGWEHVSEPCASLAREFAHGYDEAGILSNQQHRAAQSTTFSSHVFGNWSRFASDDAAPPVMMMSARRMRRALGMSVTDLVTLRECVRRRKVGARVAAQLNATRTTTTRDQEDCCSHMFMSITDFVGVASANKGVLTEVLRQWSSIAHSLVTDLPVYHNIMRLMDMWKQNAVLSYLDSVWARVASVMEKDGESSEEGNATKYNLSSGVWREFGPNSTEIRWMRKFVREHRRQVHLFDMFAHERLYYINSAPQSVPDGANKTGEKAASANGTSATSNDTDTDATGDRHDGAVDLGDVISRGMRSSRSGGGGESSSMRRMLAYDPATTAVVAAYTNLVSSTNGFSSLAVSASRSMRKGSSSDEPLVTDTWLEGPFGWPPRFDFYTQDGWKRDTDRCIAFELGVQATMDVFRVVKIYYEIDFASKVASPPWALNENSPTFFVPHKMGPPSGSATGTQVPNPTWMDLATNLTEQSTLLISTMRTYTPWLLDGAAGFFVIRRGGDVPLDALTIGNVVHDAIVCDFDSVMFCGRLQQGGERKRRNIAVCFLISIVTWLAVAFAVSLVPGVGNILSTLVYIWLVVLVPSTTLQLSYGMAFTCAPLVPTCLVQDMIASIKVVLPMRINWPNALQKVPGCMQNVTMYDQLGPDRCQRSCSDAPFSFKGWEDSLGWMACLASSESCGSWNASLPFPRFADAVARYQPVALNVSFSSSAQEQEAAQDVWNAHQFCFFATLGQAIPWFVVAGAAVTVVGYAVTIPFAVLSSVVQVLVQIVTYSNVE